MYTTCLFCAASLGTNDVIERFPVGRRLAFDAVKGRLWVVCTACRRWNLTPLEERWEAIEDAERRFRDTPLRVSTGEIGLSRLREGLELVRVGAPQRPEIAAWRYGERFSRRHRRQVAVAGVALTVGAAATIGSLFSVGGILLAYGIATGAVRAAENGFAGSTAARIPLLGRGGPLLHVRRGDLALSQLIAGPDGGMAFRLAHADGVAVVDGERARHVARRLFPAINRSGGSPDEVDRAVRRLQHAGDAESLLATVVSRSKSLTRVAGSLRHELRERRSFLDPLTDEAAGSGLLALSTSLGLAIEMALNEEQERRAMDGELAELETAWREAEEIGAIADGLLLPEPVERAWARLRGR